LPVTGTVVRAGATPVSRLHPQSPAG